MIGKCANPDCSRPFLYLHEGRVFAVEVTEKPIRWTSAESSEFGLRQHRVQFFWLCDACSRRNPLAFNSCSGSLKVVLTPLASNSRNELPQDFEEELCA